VAKRSVVELVIEEVRRSVLDGALAPGATVSIAELSDRLAVSHIPVREALRRLEGEGLIVLRRSRPPIVAPLSLRDLEDIFRLRALFEADTLARAVTLYTPEDLAAIEQAWEALRIQPGDDAGALFQRHREFHSLLLRPATGEWHQRILDILWQAGERYVRLLIVAMRPASFPSRLQDAHALLLDAALSRSARAARRATLEHRDSAIQLIADLLPTLGLADGDGNGQRALAGERNRRLAERLSSMEDPG
jgi:DNA-binding GntR family transcriptional regulator